MVEEEEGMVEEEQGENVENVGKREGEARDLKV